MQETGSPTTARPVLIGAVSADNPIVTSPGGSKKPAPVFKSEHARRLRIERKFDSASKALTSLHLSHADIADYDPNLILVLEAVQDDVSDLAPAARKAGFEIMFDAENEADDDFGIDEVKPKAARKVCLHAICANSAALRNIVGAWKEYTRGKRPHGYATLIDIFAHLHDIRVWGPQDRVRIADWTDFEEPLDPGALRSVEIELWYRKSSSDRAKSESIISKVVEASGGAIVHRTIIDEIGYHGMKCEIPADLVVKLARGEFDDVALIRSPEIMSLRVPATDHLLDPSEILDTEEVPAPAVGVEEPLPALGPNLCILDGVPVSNHEVLQGRVEVFDPDGLESEAKAEDRRHGTAMASVAVWGDLSAPSGPLDRTVLVRPILVPKTESGNEEISDVDLTPDLMIRVFEEIFGTDSQAGSHPGISVVNLSVGDPTTPFDTAISAWARTLDWLCYRYGVLIVVSAGNHRTLSLGSMSVGELMKLSSKDRRDAILTAQIESQLYRRILSPAESINSLTVGAAHGDGSELGPPYRHFDPLDGLAGISPMSPISRGYGMAIKPEIVASGGRIVAREPMLSGDARVTLIPSMRGPGIKAASSKPAETVYICGTSPAAALVSRYASRLFDLLESVDIDGKLNRRQRVCAVKALVVQSAEAKEWARVGSGKLLPGVGYGEISRDLTMGCSANEAVVVFAGSIKSGHEQRVEIPLPEGLEEVGVKRIHATLAWISPVNWRHRKYRVAGLQFTTPKAPDLPELGTAKNIGIRESQRGATTVQSAVWEIGKAVAGSGVLPVMIKCSNPTSQEAREETEYAIVITFEVAPELGIEVYEQVRERLKARVGVRA